MQANLYALSPLTNSVYQAKLASNRYSNKAGLARRKWSVTTGVLLASALWYHKKILIVEIIRHYLKYFFFAKTVIFSINSNFFEQAVVSPLTLLAVEIIKR
jgi:hypothetical protein